MPESCDMDNQAVLLARVRTLCTETDGKRGIWKRVDENRELLEFLQEHAPALLERFPFIEIWIGNQDIFLMNLLRLLELPETPLRFGTRFPRRWPGDPCIEGAYMDFTPDVAAMMAFPIAVMPSKDISE